MYIKSMGKVGPNPQTNDRRSSRTNMVGSEDKTMNLTDPKRAQTCVILVKYVCIRMMQHCLVSNPSLTTDEKHNILPFILQINWSIKSFTLYYFECRHKGLELMHNWMHYHETHSIDQKWYSFCVCHDQKWKKEMPCSLCIFTIDQ